MSYRNKTYVIFDGDEDMYAYAYMKGWKANEKIDFDFHDAHDINALRDGSNEETVKRKLRERLTNTAQAIVLIGASTKNLFRYVRWELETCLEMGIPIIAVNLNGKRTMDDALCPPIIKNKCVVHVPFRMKIMKYAMDEFVDNFSTYAGRNLIDCYYPDDVYKNLGLV